jgi:Beta/Gamma crystallin
MPKRAALCAAIAVAALAVGVPTMASAVTTRTVVRSAPVRVNTTVRTNTRVNVVRTPQIKTTVRKTTTTTTQFRKLNVSGTGPGTGGHNPKFHKGMNPSNVQVAPATLKVSPALHVSPALKLGPGTINPALVKPVNFPVIKLANNKFAPIWKTQHKIWWGGKWKYFVPFTALGVVLVGGTYFYPDAYVGFARPYCVGLTPDGCQLNWQMVNFEDGGADWQCVQFCPRPNALPPPQAAALVAPPPVPQGTCELTIFSETNFAGTGVTTGDEQPQLSQSGWQNQIASIQVKSGTWDFFTDENFTGNTMRLQPGPYQDLGPEWSKRIGSFMCVQPGQ